MDVNRLPDTVTRSMHDYWMLFLFEGVAFVVLGCVGTIGNRNSVNCQFGRDLIPGLAFSRKWSHRPCDNFLGATHTWILVVSRVCLARDSCGAVLIAHRSKDLY